MRARRVYEVGEGQDVASMAILLAMIMKPVRMGSVWCVCGGRDNVAHAAVG